MNPNKLNLSMVILLLLGVVLACSSVSRDDSQADIRTEITKDKPQVAGKHQRLESYTVHGIIFSYYQIPARLSREELINAAQEIHLQEPSAQLILIDDDSQLADYVAYAREISAGNREAKLPKEWADAHIIGNVQKYLSGKWMLCEGNGYKEIAGLK